MVSVLIWSHGVPLGSRLYFTAELNVSSAQFLRVRSSVSIHTAWACSDSFNLAISSCSDLFSLTWDSFDRLGSSGSSLVENHWSISLTNLFFFFLDG